MKKVFSIITAAALVAAAMPAAPAAADGTYTVLSGNKYYLAASIEGGSAEIDISELDSDSAVTGYVVTTADEDGELIEQTTVNPSGDTIAVSGAAAEIAPVYRYENLTGLSSAAAELKTEIEDGLYNFTFLKADTKRTDIYVNGAMVINNLQQTGYNRSVKARTTLRLKDINVTGGSVSVSLTDTQGKDTLDYCEFYKAPTIIERKPKVYVIGDSLVASYYGTISGEDVKAQYGWGQVIGDLFTDDVEVVNLANGGHYATILETTAFPGVIANAQSGDYLLIESGYNDMKHNEAIDTQEAVERMVRGAEDKGIIPIVVSPNASMQKDELADDYAESVRYTAAMKAAAENTGALYIDLSGESYKFYREHYGDDRDTAINTYHFPKASTPDYLHHNYLGAVNCARIVAQGMYDAGIGFINTDYEYTFTDAAGEAITLAVNTEAPQETDEPETTATPSPEPTAQPTETPTATPKPTAVPDMRECVKITAEYDAHGRLTDMRSETIKASEITDEENTEIKKVFYWESLAGMKPFEPLTEETEAPTETEQPTAPAQSMPPAENKAEVLDLAGNWELSLSSYDSAAFNDSVTLPGTLSENKKGKQNNSTDKTKLSLRYTYSGSASYRKKVNIPADWADKSVVLTLERTKLTRVWVNGAEETDCTTSNSIAVPHEYRLKNLVPGGENTITVEVTNGTGSNEGKSDNVYGLFRSKTHMLTAETQTDWNGIIGEVALKAADKVYISDIMVYPDVKNSKTAVKAVVQNDSGAPAKGTLNISAVCRDNGDTIPQKEYSSEFAAGESTLEFVYDMGDNVKLWSEFHPSLYDMTVSLKTQSGERNDYVESFGMRDWGTSEGQFTINGNKTFLRGEANSAVFPENGYPYMTREEWLNFFGKAKSMGINFFRFHSWIPPMAAFKAADELGIYMQPEMYGFGGTPTANDFNNTLYGEDGINALKYLASSPSFVMMTFGNEMTTTGQTAAFEDYRARLKAIDSTRLYAGGTNNDLSVSNLNANDDFWTTAKVGMGGHDQQIRLSFAWNNDSEGGRLEGEQPNSCQTFDKAIEYLNSDIPVMGHETGQYQVLPKFDQEIEKYNDTVFAPRNLSNFKSIMQNKGLLYMNDKFSESTARTSAIQYRADIEAALKTNSFGGYQLLSIQDFPGQNTALVGILDSFMDDKDGGFTSEEYKSFNSPVTVLAKLPKYTYNTSDELDAEIVIANYSENELRGVAAQWSLTDDEGSIIKQGTTGTQNSAQGHVTSLGTVIEPSAFAGITKAQKLTFTVSAAGSENSYSLWVYSEITVEKPADLLVADAYTKEVRDTLEAGGKVLMIPAPDTTNLPNSVSVRWTNDYWSSMFHGRVTGAANTMGIYMDENAPVFGDFPTESFGDYQWYNLMKNSRAVILDGAPADFEPLVWNIDHMAYSRKLGSIFEAKVGEGSLLVCTMDVLAQMDKYPEVRQMYNSLVSYASSDAFAPSKELTEDYLRTILKPVINSEGTVSAYDMIGGSEYSWSQTKSALKSQTGTDENGGAVTNAAGGISAGDMLRFDNVRFDGNGSTTLKIKAANGAANTALVEVYLSSESGEKLAEIEFENTGGWDKFRTREFTVPHLWGEKNILLKFTNANICLGGIVFEESADTYRDPYSLIDPSNTSAGAVEITDIGGTHEVEQLTVKIDGAVRLTVPNCDFGFIGSSGIVIGGSVLGESGEAKADIVYSENGEEKRIPVVFRNGEGESYTLESGTTGGLEFWRNTIALPSVISGVQDIALEFVADTSMQLSDIVFTDEANETKEWDFSEYKSEVKTTESGFTEEYNGLIIAIANNGADSDHDSISSNGVYWRGGASSGDSARYIEYTPKVSGTLYVTGKIAKNDGRWGISASRTVTSLKDDGSSSKSTSTETVSMHCDAGVTYYVINKSRAANIYSLSFILE